MSLVTWFVFSCISLGCWLCILLMKSLSACTNILQQDIFCTIHGSGSMISVDTSEGYPPTGSCACGLWSMTMMIPVLLSLSSLPLLPNNITLVMLWWLCICFRTWGNWVLGAWNYSLGMSFDWLVVQFNTLIFWKSAGHSFNGVGYKVLVTSNYQTIWVLGILSPTVPWHPYDLDLIARKPRVTTGVSRGSVPFNSKDTRAWTSANMWICTSCQQALLHYKKGSYDLDATVVRYSCTITMEHQHINITFALMGSKVNHKNVQSHACCLVQ